MTRSTLRGDAADLIDTDRYPLGRPDSAAWAAAVDRVRADLRVDGCSVLRGFLRPELLERVQQEGRAVAPHAHRATEIVNVYHTATDPRLPGDHPARRTVERGNAFVPGDRIPADQLIARLHRAPEMRRFVAACVEVPEVFPLADPLAGLCLNVVSPGQEHPWHFDTNEFAVTLLTQAPDGGGVFEYVPGIRTPSDENPYAVGAVLDGERGRVRSLRLRVGDLQIFRGRYSLHRVTAVAGAVERHTAVLSYTERPGVVGSLERTRQLFGRVLPVHTAAARTSTDGLLD
ncbi:HalD/BesD family halogenase [Pseudonocardia xishanensis]|uniref:Fe2OG dioxygenase domain-containing protein n=1 Tax=Pseudonocardia xishanensis TaxID=630995 RepID=A0ABP8RST7_9PSEU